MDLRKLKKLIDLVEESGIAELEITEGEEKVRISKSANSAQGSVTQTVTTAPQQTPVFYQDRPYHAAFVGLDFI